MSIFNTPESLLRDAAKLAGRAETLSARAKDVAMKYRKVADDALLAAAEQENDAAQYLALSTALKSIG